MKRSTSPVFAGLLLALALSSFPSAGFASLREDCYKLNVAGHDGWQLKAIRADGNYVVAEDEKNHLFLLDSATLKTVLPLGSISGGCAASIGPDGSRIAIGEGQGRIRILDGKTGKPIVPDVTDKHGVSSLDFSQDGRRIVVMTDAHVAVLDASTGKAVAPPIIDAPSDWGSDFSSAQLSPDNRLILTTNKLSMRPARLWDVQTAKQVRVLDSGLRSVRNPNAITDQAFATVFSPDGSTIATAEELSDEKGWKNVARIWDTKSGAVLFTSAEMVRWVTAVAFSRDGRLLAVGACGVTVFDIRRKIAVTREMGIDIIHYSLHVGFSPDGRRVFTTGRTLYASIFDVATQKELFDFSYSDDTSAAGFNSDGTRFITNATNSDYSPVGIYAWDVSKSPAK